MTVYRLFGESPIKNVKEISMSGKDFGYKLSGDEHYRVIPLSRIDRITEN